MRPSSHLPANDAPSGFGEGLLRQSRDARRSWEGVKEGKKPIAAAISPKPLNLGKIKREIMRQDAVLNLGLRFGNGFMRLGQLLHVIYPSPDWVMVALCRANT